MRKGGYENFIYHKYCHRLAEGGGFILLNAFRSVITWSKLRCLYQGCGLMDTSEAFHGCQVYDISCCETLYASYEYCFSEYIRAAFWYPGMLPAGLRLFPLKEQFYAAASAFSLAARNIATLGIYEMLRDVPKYIWLKLFLLKEWSTLPPCSSAAVIIAFSDI